MTNWQELTAGDVMRSPVATIPLGATLDEALRTLSEERVGGAPVVDGRGAVVGVLSQVDVLAFLDDLEGGFGNLGERSFARAALRRDPQSGSFSNLSTEDEDLLRATPVAAVMSPDVASVEPTTRLPAIVRTMLDQELHRVVVIDGDTLCGVITTMDVMAALLGRAARRRTAG